MFDVNIYLLLSILLAGLLTSFGKTTGLNVLGIFTVTMMSLIFPAKEAVGVLLPVLLMGDLIAVFFYRRTVVWKHLFSLVPWILIGVLIGYFVLRTSDNEQLKILLGYLILGLNLFQIVKDYFGSKIGSGITEFHLVYRTNGNISRFRHDDWQCCRNRHGHIFVITSVTKE